MCNLGYRDLCESGAGLYQIDFLMVPDLKKKNGTD
jgi:hypothetical protein